MLAPRPRVPDVRKIGVLRAGGLGDLLFALPALRALRRAYAEAELVLLTGDWQAAFLDGRGIADRAVVVPPTEGVRPGPHSPEDLTRFFSAMEAEGFDLALKMHGGGRYTNPFLRRLSARVTAGPRTPDAEDLDITMPYIYFQHEVMRLLEVAALVGAPAVTVEPEAPLLPADLAEADSVYPEDRPPLVLVHPRAGDGRRRWPPDKFAQVAERLAAEGLSVGVIGASEERWLVETVLTASRAPLLDLCGRLSLGCLAGLLSRCAVFIGNDSGPRHLAQAVGASTVAIYWCGNLINAGPLSRGRHRPLLSWELLCPVCGVNTIHTQCEHHESFVADVGVEEVVAHALDLLRQPAATARVAAGRAPRSELLPQRFSQADDPGSVDAPFRNGGL
jgi:ADP-heptose:LPS heptosyltransferase